MEGSHNDGFDLYFFLGGEPINELRSFSHFGRYSPALNKGNVDYPAHYPGDWTNPHSTPHSCLGLSRVDSPLSSSGSRDDPAGDPTDLIPRGADRGGPVTGQPLPPSPAGPRPSRERDRDVFRRPV